jgi:peptide-methionine (R)-S-oxide reductase
MAEHKDRTTGYEVTKTDAQWREELTDEQYRVLRQAGTEAPGCGTLLHNKAEGTYVCAGCSQPLFISGSKFRSGTGWPSYTQPVDEDHIEEVHDTSHGMVRTEVRCSRCGGHLGHVFKDGPAPTGLRYCINSAALEFEPK